MDEIKLCLQVLDTGDSSESFPGNRLDLVLTEVSGLGGEAEMEGGDIRPGVHKNTTNDKLDRKYLLCERIQTYVHIVNYSTKARREGWRGWDAEKGGSDMTFMISGTIWF